MVVLPPLCLAVAVAVEREDDRWRMGFILACWIRDLRSC